MFFFGESKTLCANQYCIVFPYAPCIEYLPTFTLNIDCPNVGKYSIHGASGIAMSLAVFSCLEPMVSSAHFSNTDYHTVFKAIPHSTVSPISAAISNEDPLVVPSDTPGNNCLSLKPQWPNLTHIVFIPSVHQHYLQTQAF